jgi:glycosyltransferase involved in cell wall biosynthesis
MRQRVVALSEHYIPRVGGTVRYVDQTCSALQAQGIDVHLIVPGPRPSGALAWNQPYRVTWLDAGYPGTGDPSRRSRYHFCREADRLVQNLAKREEIDVVHVLFGLFLMEVLDTASLNRINVPCVATVHNLPPMECSRSWEGDAWYRRVEDAVRLRAIEWKNNKRLRRHDYNLYVTPCAQVCNELQRVLPGMSVEVNAHGISSDLLAQMQQPSCRRPRHGQRLELLTLGGWVPHKRQHLIPAAASLLKARGLDLHWHVAGPTTRISGYKDSVDAEIGARGLSENVTTSGTLPFARLAGLYDKAHLYLQPSTEEGFCITALDAAAAGLPVIGSPAGALPEICRASGGRLVPSEASAIAAAVVEFVAANAWPDSSDEIASRVVDQFSWDKTARRLRGYYGRTCEAFGRQSSTPAT